MGASLLALAKSIYQTVDKSCQKKNIHRVYQNLVYRKDPERAFVKKHHYKSFYYSHSVPLPLIVFLAHFFFSMLFARSTQDNATGPDEFLTCATRFEGTDKFSYRLQYCLQLKIFTVPRVACKEQADPCKFLAVEKFVKGVIVLTRVGTFSIILIIDRSRTPGSLEPLGSFLFTGVAVKELTSPTSLRHWICQKHSPRCLT